MHPPLKDGLKVRMLEVRLGSKGASVVQDIRFLYCFITLWMDGCHVGTDSVRMDGCHVGTDSVWMDGCHVV